MTELKSMKVIIQRKSYLFGLFQPISKIYFDTKEAPLTSRFKVEFISPTRFFITNPTDKLHIEAHIDPRSCAWLSIVGHLYIDKSQCLYIDETSDSSFDVIFRSDIMNYNDAMYIVHHLLMKHYQ